MPSVKTDRMMEQLRAGLTITEKRELRHRQEAEMYDALADAIRELLLQIDDGPRWCYGKMSNGDDVWKGSFLSRVERMRQLVARLDAGDGLKQ